MTHHAIWAAIGLVLVGCAESGSMVIPVPELDFRLMSPEYGDFVGEEGVTVSGWVSHAAAVVVVEGEEVEIGDDGWWSVEIPVASPYRWLDVSAALVDQHVEERVVVFRGQDPMETWPGGVEMLFTANALQTIADDLGEAVDATGWDATLLELVPEFELGGFRVLADELAHRPTEVTLSSSREGIEMGLSMREVSLNMLAGVDLGFLGWLDVPASAGIEEMSFVMTLRPTVSAEGELALELVSTEVEMNDVILDIVGFDLSAIAGIADLVVDLLVLGADLLMDSIFGIAGEIPLGGPVEFETDLLGTIIEMRLSELLTSEAGVGVGLGIGLGMPAAEGPLDLPPIRPEDFGPRAHLIVQLHEGLMQPLLESELVDLLTQEIALGGIFSEVLEVSVRAIDGGDEAPDEAFGWCVSLDMGDARVVRLHDGLDPFGAIYLPDARVSIGWQAEGSSACRDWLEASLAIDVGLFVNGGTKIGIEMQVTEGKVLLYEAERYEEQQVIDDLSGFLTSITDLLGGTLEIDLADILGGDLLGAGGIDFGGLEGLLGDLANMEMRILDSKPVVGHDGLYSVSVSLFPR